MTRGARRETEEIFVFGRQDTHECATLLISRNPDVPLEPCDSHQVPRDLIRDVGDSSCPIQLAEVISSRCGRKKPTRKQLVVYGIWRPAQ